VHKISRSRRILPLYCTLDAQIDIAVVIHANNCAGFKPLPAARTLLRVKLLHRTCPARGCG